MALTLDGVKYMMDIVFFRSRSAASSLWIALTTEDIDPSATGSELHEPGDTYNRVQYQMTPGGWNRVGTTLSNSVRVVFPKASTDWGQITNWALVTSATGGEVLMEDRFSTPYLVLKGDQVEIPVGSMGITYSIGGWSL